jgi:hypothetical protein
MSTACTAGRAESRRSGVARSSFGIREGLAVTDAVSRVRTLAAAVVALTVAATGCNLVAPVEDGSTGRDADAGPDLADVAAEADSDGEPRPGPLTLVAREVVVLEDRLCDLDGDGVADNAIADLGQPAASLVAAAVTAAIPGALERSRRRGGLHFPWIDDLRGPSDPDTLVLPLAARDTDVPQDPHDDFSGEEPFCADAAVLDRCGEPRVAIEGARLDDGALSRVEADLFPVVPEVFDIRGGRIWGTIAPSGDGGEVQICGYVLASDAGASPGLYVDGMPDDETPSLLEQLLVGGAAFGLPFGGIAPDVDLDGDGLERFLLDENGRLAGCIDGGGRVIDGRDCVQDPGMADGFGLAVRVSAVRGFLVGRAPGWDYDVEGHCDGGMAAESVFNFGEPAPGCAELDEVCDPRSATPCCDPSHRCSGANRSQYLCLEPCDAVRCDYGGRVGVCASQGCTPAGGRRAVADCELGQLCTTEYGADGGACVLDPREAERFCLEACAQTTGPCGDDADQYRCMPLAFEDGGVCAWFPPAGR